MLTCTTKDNTYLNIRGKATSGQHININYTVRQLLKMVVGNSFRQTLLMVRTTLNKPTEQYAMKISYCSARSTRTQA
jgi:hypothetical protein